jgi:lantibiotic leader peptide-processing serine protease
MEFRKLALPVALVGGIALAGCSADRALDPTSATVAPSKAASASTVSATGALDAGIAGNYLVRFKGNAIPTDFAAKVASMGGEVIFAHAGVGVAAVSGLDNAGADLLAARSDVQAVDADAYTTLEQPADATVESAALTPDSPTAPSTAFFFPRQWNMRAISAPAAWAAGALGSSTTRVGIVDTGIDYLHPDLYGRVDLNASRSFLSAAENARVQALYPGANPIADLNYHGTHVAATVASNGLAAAGVTSKVTLVGLKVCVPGTAANNYTATCPTSGTLSAILYASDIGLDVINMSLGGYFERVDASARGGNGPSFLATINRVMNYANRKGTLVVVSAGNSAIDLDHDGNGYASYCSAAGVVCVSATGPTAQASTNGPWTNVDALAYYSNYGRSAISVAAPGGNFSAVYAACSGFTIYPPLAPCKSRFYNPTTGAWSASVVGLAGTSMAAPHVTGTAALIAGRVGHNPSQIQARLEQSADDLGQPGTDPAYGKGRINVAHAAGL